MAEEISGQQRNDMRANTDRELVRSARRNLDRMRLALAFASSKN